MLKDIVLFPVRLFGGILGFFDFFTMKYSGKTLNSSAGAAKSKSESQRFVLGNLIDAERELKRNSEHGEEYPGYVPREYELCRMNNGKQTSWRGESVLMLCAAAMCTVQTARMYSSLGTESPKRYARRIMSRRYA